MQGVGQPIVCNTFRYAAHTSIYSYEYRVELGQSIVRTQDVRVYVCTNMYICVCVCNAYFNLSNVKYV